MAGKDNFQETLVGQYTLQISWTTLIVQHRKHSLKKENINSTNDTCFAFGLQRQLRLWYETTLRNISRISDDVYTMFDR
jgi:hypothetical protein